MPTAESGGLRIAYDDLGSGMPVVLGHSFLCSREMWAGQVPRLAAEHRVVNLDLRGHGASGHAREPFHLDALVGDALTVLDELEIENAVWAGLSVGGMVALRAALQVPDRVRALILIDTDAGSETVYNRIKYSALGWVAKAMGMRPLLPQVRRTMFGPTTLRSQRDLVAAWSERFAQVDVPSALRMLTALKRRRDLHHRLPGIQVPALVVVGEEDVSLPPERSRRLAAALPRSRFVEVPEAGHLSALERPGVVTDVVLDFLGQLD